MDADALRRLLEKAICQPGLRDTLGETGRAAVAPLSWTATAEHLRKLLREAAA
jgi:hypothetical protein